VGGLGRRSVNFFLEALISEFRVKELILDIFFLPSVYRLIPVAAGRGNGGVDSRVDGRFQRISLISFFRNLINL